jgi:photosystem II stability/assembly factor-like uncharacterized protein
MKTQKMLSFILMIVFLFWGTKRTFPQDFWEPTNGPFGGYVSAFAINSSEHIFAGTLGSGIFCSIDNGSTWKQTGLTDVSIRSIAIDTTGQIFAATEGDGVYRSSDNGDSWTQINNGLTSLTVRAIAINSSGDLFAGTWWEGGIFRSTDNGDNWTQINNGLTIPAVYSLVINSSGDIFAGTSGAGVFRSTNDGDDWIEINNGLIDNDCKRSYLVNSLAINSSDYIFAGTSKPTWGDSKVFLSTNNGENWVGKNSGLPGDRINSLAINSKGHIFAGTISNGIYRSMNNGDSWFEINTGLPNNPVFCLGVNSSDYIFAGFERGGVFRSTDNGDNWTEVNNGLGYGFDRVYSLAVTPEGYVIVGSESGVYYSIDNGDNWTRIYFLRLDDFYTETVSIAANSTAHIYMGTMTLEDPIGIWLSSDVGANWEERNTGLLEKRVRCLAFNASDHLFIGTHGGGVFRSKESTVTVEDFTLEMPNSFSLAQNYPNPFNSSTTIQFSLPKTSFVTLKVYNMLGEEVSTLVAENLTGGNYHIEWDATGFVSGVYYYRLEVGGFVETRKLILLK